MSGVNLRAIRDGLAAQISNGLARHVSVDAYPGTTSVLPNITIESSQPYVTYHETFGDRCLVGIELSLLVVTAAADGRSAWIVMDDLLSPGGSNASSVVHAVEADPTIGGLVGNCWVSIADAAQINADGHVECMLSVHITANQSPT